MVPSNTLNSLDLIRRVLGYAPIALKLAKCKNPA